MKVFEFNMIFSTTLWQALTHSYAIIIYVVILFLSIMAVVISYVLRHNTTKSDDNVNNDFDGNANNGAEKLGNLEQEPNEKHRSRFYMLNQIDENRAKYIRTEDDDKLSLEELCYRFRDFAASQCNLYYDISDIRKFVAGLLVSKIIILQGISGTGKTSLAYAFGEFLSNPSTVIPVQPMWKERTDLVGYYNEFTKRFNETTLLKKMYEANYSKEIFVTILDEMNIARIEYYFAEFLSLLELPNEKRRFLDVVSDKEACDPAKLINGQILLPDNMWFVGTANNDDTTFSISDKVYDRAMILNLDFRSEPFNAPPTSPVKLSAERFKELAIQAQKEYSVTKRNEKRLKVLDKFLIDNFHITFGNRIKKQIMTFIPIYLSCGGDELEALDDILAKKLIRKLELQNPVHVKNAAEGFVAMLDELFGKNEMLQCKSYISRITKNL